MPPLFRMKLDLHPMKTLQKNIAREVKKGARPIVAENRKDAKQDAPVLTGQLRKSITTKEWVNRALVYYFMLGPEIRDNNEGYKYARMIDDQTHFLSQQIDEADLAAFNEMIRDRIFKLL